MARVLVVDDDPHVRLAVVLRLERDGHTVEQATDGQAAFDRMTRPGADSVDVVVLDLLMPVLDGYEFLERATRDPRTADTPVLVLSGRDGAAGIVRALEVGAADYVVKPFHARELSARVDLALRRDRARSTLTRVEAALGSVAGLPAAERDTAVRELVAGWPAQDGPLVALLQLCLAVPRGRARRPADPGNPSPPAR